MKRTILLSALLMFLALPATVEAASSTLDLGPWLENGSRYRSTSAFQSMDVTYDGEIRVSDDDKSIKSISPGGYLKINIRTFGNSRELLVNSSSSGKLSYEFKEGRKEVPYEPEGRRWLSDVLIDVVRSTSIDVEGRTMRFYSNGGVDAFLNEISYIRSNSMKVRYFSALLDKGGLTKRELSELAYAITGKISSNSDCGRLMRKYNDLFLQDPGVAEAYFSALSKITSSTEKGRTYRAVTRALDFNHSGFRTAYFAGVDRISSSTEQGSVLRHTIENQDLPPAAQSALLRSAGKIASNSESGRVLRSLDPDLNNPDVVVNYFRSVDLLSSDTETGSSIRYIISKGDLNDNTMITLLNSTKKISSSTEVGSVIRSIPSIDLNDPQVQDAYFNVIRATSSSTESGRMLRYTTDHHSLNASALVNLYETNKRISSDTEVSSVLRASIPVLIYEATVLNAFFECTNRLSSSTEHGRVLRELTKSSRLERTAMEGILLSARRISSNTERGSVLRAIAPKLPEGDKELRDMYLETARSLSSDSEFRRAMDAIM